MTRRGSGPWAVDRSRSVTHQDLGRTAGERRTREQSCSACAAAPSTRTAASAPALVSTGPCATKAGDGRSRPRPRLLPTPGWFRSAGGAGRAQRSDRGAGVAEAAYLPLLPGPRTGRGAEGHRAPLTCLPSTRKAAPGRDSWLWVPGGTRAGWGSGPEGGDWRKPLPVTCGPSSPIAPKLSDLMARDAGPGPRPGAPRLRPPNPN